MQLNLLFNSINQSLPIWQAQDNHRAFLRSSKRPMDNTSSLIILFTNHVTFTPEHASNINTITYLEYIHPD
jgi:hypothetical protein